MLPLACVLFIYIIYITRVTSWGVTKTFFKDLYGLCSVFIHVYNVSAFITTIFSNCSFSSRLFLYKNKIMFCMVCQDDPVNEEIPNSTLANLRVSPGQTA